MAKEEVDELLKKAKDKIDDPDVIVSVYDLTFQWMGEKLIKIIGYDASEIMDKQTLYLYPNPLDQSRKNEMEILLATKDIIKEIPVKTKEGAIIKIEFRISHFMYNDDPYMVGKVLKVIR